MLKSARRLFSVVLAMFMLSSQPLLCLAASDKEIQEIAIHSIPPEYVYTDFDASDGLPSNTVNAVASTPDGFMWFGTDCGLVKYNAKSFSLVDFENADFENSCISALDSDNSGNLWIGTSENGLFYLKDSKVTKFDTKGYLSATVNSIDTDINGNVVVATTGGIAIIDDETLEIYSPQAELTPADKNISSISVSESGLIWCVTNNGTIYFIADDVKAYVDIDGENGNGFLTDELPKCVYASDSGRIFVGTESDDIIYFDPCDDGSFDSGIIECIGVNSIYNFSQDSFGKVWFCSDNGIGYIYENSAYLVESQFSGNVTCSYVDFEGSTWFGSMREGALKLSNAKFVNINILAGIYGELSNAVAVYDNLLFIGTDSGLVIYDALSNGAIIKNDLTTLLSNVKINSLVSDENGNLLIGANEKYGLIKYNAGGDSSWTIFNSENGLLGESVFAVSLLADGSVAVGTEKGVSIIADNELKNAYELPSSVNALAVDSADNIYAATPIGAYLLANNEALLMNDELSEMNITDIFYDAQSASVIVSAENAVYISSNSKLTDISEALPENLKVLDVLKNSENELIFVCNNEIYKSSVEDLLKDKKCEKYCGIESLPCSVTKNSQSYFVNDTLYVCSVDGVIAVNKQNTFADVPKITVNAVYCDGQKVKYSDMLKIDSNVKMLEFDISVLSYLGDNELKYKMNGFDETENTASAEGIIKYANLDGGKYTFEVYGVNSAGIKSELLKIEITKEKMWHESPLFWIVLVLSVVIISFLVNTFYIVEKVRKEEQLQNQLSSLSTQAIEAVAETIDAKSNVSRGHSKRVALYSAELARRLKCTDEFIERLYCAALMHDIGNISVSDEILKKPHKLTPEELLQVQKHSELGSEILREHEALRDLSDAVLYHHERYDGMGYCKKLKGDAIPLSARIIFACESLDAMLTEKPYRPKLTRERIINEFRVGAGTQFDPDIAQTAIKMVESNFKPE